MDTNLATDVGQALAVLLSLAGTLRLLSQAHSRVNGAMGGITMSTRVLTLALLVSVGGLYLWIQRDVINNVRPFCSVACV